jgi:hypothetical protein
MMLGKLRISVILPLSLAVTLLTSCVVPASTVSGDDGVDLRTRLVAANLLAGTMAEGLIMATRVQAIKPGGDQALLIRVTLDAVDRSLDGAGTALRAGLPELAARQIGAAESQLDGLQPLLPPPGAGKPAGDKP